MTKRKIKTFTALIDTREKTPWNFTFSQCITEVRIATLKTGDYTVEGFENEFAIERKRSTAEIAQNFLEPRFKNVLSRLESYKHKFIICEFSLENVLEYPRNAGIPKYLMAGIRLTPAFLLSCLSKIQVDFHIPVIFAGNSAYAEIIAENLMKRIV